MSFSSRERTKALDRPAMTDVAVLNVHAEARALPLADADRIRVGDPFAELGRQAPTRG